MEMTKITAKSLPKYKGHELLEELSKSELIDIAFQIASELSDEKRSMFRVAVDAASEVLIERDHQAMLMLKYGGDCKLWPDDFDITNEDAIKYEKNHSLARRARATGLDYFSYG